MGPEYEKVRSPEEYCCCGCVITEILHIYYSFSKYEEEILKKNLTESRKDRFLLWINNETALLLDTPFRYLHDEVENYNSPPQIQIIYELQLFIRKL